MFKRGNATVTRFGRGLRYAAGLCLFLGASFALAETLYQPPAEFLSEHFEGKTPEAALLWLTGDRGEIVKQILGHPPSSLRVRYWRRGDRTAWVLEEIGREKPITAGFVIDAGRLAQVRTLAFRESRGWEIRHDFFTDQFKGVKLTDKQELTQPIDNITGATLSVNAMKRMARVALYLDSEVRRVTP